MALDFFVMIAAEHLLFLHVRLIGGEHLRFQRRLFDLGFAWFICSFRRHRQTECTYLHSFLLQQSAVLSSLPHFAQLFLFKKHSSSCKVDATAHILCCARLQLTGASTAPLIPADFFQIMVRSCPKQSKTPEGKKARYATAIGACLPLLRHPFFFC